MDRSVTGPTPVRRDYDRCRGASAGTTLGGGNGHIDGGMVDHGTVAVMGHGHPAAGDLSVERGRNPVPGGPAIF